MCNHVAFCQVSRAWRQLQKSPELQQGTVPRLQRHGPQEVRHPTVFCRCKGLVLDYVGMSGEFNAKPRREDGRKPLAARFSSPLLPIPDSPSHAPEKEAICCSLCPHSPLNVLDKRHAPLLPGLALDRGLGLRFVIFWSFLPIFGTFQSCQRPAAESVSSLVLLSSS
ncbi:hypothetical protein BDW71DRAFT_79505 [Aspergillus fruticulosus]